MQEVGQETRQEEMEEKKMTPNQSLDKIIAAQREAIEVLERIIASLEGASGEEES